MACAAVTFGYLSYLYLTLPDVRPLARSNPPSTAFMRLRAAQALRSGDTLHLRHTWVRDAHIATSLKRAVLVAEDSAFYDHEGIDLEQIRASIEVNWEEGRFARGASTITQQLAKNLYLSPSRNPARKLRELLIARRLEAELSKRRILEIYLNVIEWGDGVFGCEAASRTYFRKGASALTVEEAALLAGAIINPRELSPAHPSRRLYRRQQIILRRLGVRPRAHASSRHPTRADIAPRPVRQVQPLDAHDAAFAWRVYELAAAERDGDVRSLRGAGRKKQQISRGDLVSIHRRPRRGLTPHVAREHHLVLPEHVLHEPAAIEAVRAGAAVRVWHTA